MFWDIYTGVAMGCGPIDHHFHSRLFKMNLKNELASSVLQNPSCTDLVWCNSFPLNWNAMELMLVVWSRLLNFVHELLVFIFQIERCSISSSCTIFTSVSRTAHRKNSPGLLPLLLERPNRHTLCTYISSNIRRVARTLAWSETSKHLLSALSCFPFWLLYFFRLETS